MLETPRNPQPDRELKPLRTYESDVEELLQKENVSLSNIALAESNKKRNQPETPPPIKAPPLPPKVGKVLEFAPLQETRAGGNSVIFSANRRYMLATVVTLVAVAFAGIGLFLFLRARQNARRPSIIQTTATHDASAVTVNEKETRAGFIKKIRDGVGSMPITLNEIKTFAVRAGEQTITTPLVFERMEARARPSLIRALGAEPVFGIHATRGTQLFLLIPALSFENAFDGMLAFEKTMLDDMGPLFGINPRAVSSASATAGSPGAAWLFKDTVIKNRDARAIFDRSGEITFLYSFVDAQTLIITTNEDTLKILLGKASKGKLRQ